MAETTRTWTQAELLSLIARLRGDSPLRPHDTGFAADALAALLAERDRPTPTEVFERKAMAVMIGDVLEDGRVVTKVKTVGEGRFSETWITIREGNPGFPTHPSAYLLSSHAHVRLISRASAPAAQPATPDWSQCPECKSMWTHYESHQDTCSKFVGNYLVPATPTKDGDA
jgi:hypothetical protein